MTLTELKEKYGDIRILRDILQRDDLTPEQIKKLENLTPEQIEKIKEFEKNREELEELKKLKEVCDKYLYLIEATHGRCKNRSEKKAKSPAERKAVRKARKKTMKRGKK